MTTRPRVSRRGSSRRSTVSTAAPSPCSSPGACASPGVGSWEPAAAGPAGLPFDPTADTVRPRTRRGRPGPPPRGAAGAARPLLSRDVMPDEPTAPAEGTAYPAEAPPAGEPARSQKRLRELPADVLLPRDKLLRFGVAGLSQAELVAVLLGSGTKGRSVIRIAEDLVGRHGGQKLVTLSLDEWASHRGVGRVKAAQMLATFELG